MLTWLPWTIRRWPSVTTVSEGLRPLLITVSRPAVRSTTTELNFDGLVRLLTTGLALLTDLHRGGRQWQRRSVFRER
jgi:ABC-type transporter Mla MlaB component